ncbi:hypothetical protein [Pseudoalteromonas sp. bablab_jr011]|uniref:hypothetical protein n=1 Tax=Pseudoalteromonas sp. bablab_jr011 TaxID=2755062 RepID=UPI0018F7A29E|nr:hypothetical protein [Pseudoalteromonas sp. bablab_jr011]
MSIASVSPTLNVMSTLRLSTAIRYTGYLVGTAGAIYLVEKRYAENLWMMAESASSPFVQSENDRVAYEGNRRQYKNRCQEQYPGGGSQCDKWEWELRRNRDCADLREEFSKRWFGGADENHQNAINEYRKAADKLQKKSRKVL